MQTTLRQLLEEITYDFYMWDYDRDKFDEEISEYTDLTYIEDFSEMALKYWEDYEAEHAVNNWEPDYVWMADSFVESIETSYTWMKDWEEIDIDDIIINN